MGVSADQVDRQCSFANENDLGFPLLSDPDRRVIKQFGVNRIGPLPTKRVTFVIDESRRVVERIATETNMHAHADEALAAVRKRAAETAG